MTRATCSPPTPRLHCAAELPDERFAAGGLVVRLRRRRHRAHPLDGDAKQAVSQYVRLYDLWEQGVRPRRARSRMRFGNQVVSWGESLFMIGGINSNVAMDLQRPSARRSAEGGFPALAGAVGRCQPGSGKPSRLTTSSSGSPTASRRRGRISRERFLRQGRDSLIYSTLAMPPADPHPGDPFTNDLAAARGRHAECWGGHPGRRRRRARRLRPVRRLAEIPARGHGRRSRPSTTSASTTRPPTFNGTRNGAGTRMYFLRTASSTGISANTLSVGNWAVGAGAVVSAEDAVRLASRTSVGSPDQCDGSIDEERYQFHHRHPQPDARRPRLVPRPDGRRPAPSFGEAVAIAIRGEKRQGLYLRTRNGVTYQQLPPPAQWTHDSGVGDGCPGLCSTSA